MNRQEKPLIWLYGEVKSPPFSAKARIKAVFLLRRLQKGEKLEMPESRPMPEIGKQCHELRIQDINSTWRIFYYIDEDAVIILDVVAKKSQKTPNEILDRCRKRLARYHELKP